MAQLSSITGKAVWTVAVYAASALIRFSTNLVLSRLLSPGIIGVVVIAQAVRAGAELFTDLGPEQNVVHNPAGDEPRFLNTLWTLQVVRGLVVSLGLLSLSPLIGAFYEIDTLVLAAVSVVPLLSSMASTSIYTLSRKLLVKQRSLFDLAIEFSGLVLTLVLAFWWQNVWAAIVGVIASVSIRLVLSYRLPHPAHRILVDRQHAWNIVHFSKWIMLSSLAMFAALYIDRLFLGRAAGLAALGVYGLARAVSDLPQAVAGRIGFQVVFPYVAGNRGSAERGMAELARARGLFIAISAVGIGTVMSWADELVKLLYDDRYRAAGWMLFLLLIGSWVALLAALNEAVVFGYGRSRSVSAANLIRVAAMIIFLPLGFAVFNLPGAILAVPLSEACRYVTLLVAQRDSQTVFVGQDALASAGLLLIVIGWMSIRGAYSLSEPWSLIGQV